MPGCVRACAIERAYGLTYKMATFIAEKVLFNTIYLLASILYPPRPFWLVSSLQQLNFFFEWVSSSFFILSPSAMASPKLQNHELKQSSIDNISKVHFQDNNKTVIVLSTTGMLQKLIEWSCLYPSPRIVDTLTYTDTQWCLGFIHVEIHQVRTLVFGNYQ